MNNSTTHTKDHIMTRTLSLLLAGLMMLGLFGTLPLYGCSGGDTTPVATPGKDALQNATPGSDDAGQPTAEITAEPTPIPETPTPECTDEPSPTPWNPEPTPTPKPAYSYYELYYDILRDRLHRRSSGLRSFHDMESDPEMRVKYENGELWTYDFYTGEKLRQYPEELYQYALDRLRVDEVSDCYGRENWIAFLHYGDYDEPPIDISNVACILITADDWNTWNEISFTPDHDANYYAEQAILEDHKDQENFEIFENWYIASTIIQSVWVVSQRICHITIALSIDDLRPLGIFYPFVHFITTDGGEHWETIQYCLSLRAPYFEGEEGIASDYYVTHDGGRTWAFDEELWSYYRQLRKRGRWISAVLSTDRFTRTDEMRENAIKQ